MMKPKVETHGGQWIGDDRSITGLNTPFWVKVGAATGSFYAWTEQQWNPTTSTFTNKQGGRTGTAAKNPLFDANGGTLTLNSYVKIERSSFNTTRGMQYVTVSVYSTGSTTPTIITSPATGTATGPAFTFTMGTSGTDLTFSAATSTVTLNVPDASATNRGVITTGTQTIVGFKTFQNGFGTRFTDGSGNGEIELNDPSTDGGAVGYGITLNRLVLTAVADTTYSVNGVLYIGSQYAAWNSATAYVVGNNVKYLGYGYTCLVNNTNKVPNINPTEWGLQPSSYPPTDRPRFTLYGSNSADASSGAAGSKPIFEIEDAGSNLRGQWGTDPIGNVFSGGIVTAISTTFAGSSSVDTLGTITTGTWNASIIALDYGGTEADLSATGPGVVSQASSGAALTVYQSSSTGETTGFTAGAGTAVLDDSTFTGNVGATAYTISDIVKALKGVKLLAD